MHAPASMDTFWAAARKQTFLIVGFAPRTGLHAARLLERHGIRYKISDQAPREDLAPLLDGLGIDPADVMAGSQGPNQLDGITCVLLSPGVPRSIPLLREATRRGIPVLVDIDFLYPLFAHKRIVAVTGTDGKTTTTSLLGELLATSGRVVVAGNIGISVFAKTEEIASCDWLVLELSSFMLEAITQFRADYSVVLNLSEDHIDRYASRQEYASAKLAIVQHGRSSDTFVKNLDDPVLASFSPGHVHVRTISERREDADVRFAGGTFHAGGFSYPHAACRLKGRQNIPNILAALAIANEAGVKSEAIAKVLAAFGGIAHRMQHVGRFRGVNVYEDSKASNVHAVEAALRNFESNVVLILGGRDKGLDFTILRPHARRLRRVVCYGESGEKIRECLGFEDALYAYRFEDAVRLAAAQCREGDILLLSPGCTSWDQFANYEVRGDAFQQLMPEIFG